nr:hypothetical protein CFP56_39478 [Quercus suber]
MEGNASTEKEFSWGKGHANQQSSFKEKLVGELPGAYRRAFDLLDQMEVAPETELDTSGLRKGLAAVKITDELKQKIRAPWARALIVKLYGRTVGFNFLQQKISALWKPKGRLDIVDLSKDFYLVKFSAMEDYDLVLDKGPRFIGEHFLSIRPWVPNFRPCSADVSSIAVWVRLNDLPIEYYQVEALKEIGSTIGKIDVEKPLITALLIGNFEQPVNYEGIHKLCFSCGRIGHRKEDCPLIIRPVQTPAREEEDGVDKAQGSPREKHDAELAETSADEDNTYEPWMVVTRKRNGYKPNRYNSTSSTSRYLEEGQNPTGANLPKNDTSKERVHDSNRKNGMAQSSNGPQWVKADDKRKSNFLYPNQSEASPSFVGFNIVGLKASSFIPKSLGPKQIPKGKKVLAKGRAASIISKIFVASEHHNSAPLTPNNHCSSLTFMGAEMGSQSEGFYHGSGSNGESGSTDSKEAAMEAIQFSAHRSPMRRPTVIGRDGEFGFVDVHRSCETSETDSLGTSSKVQIEGGDGEISLLGNSVLNPTDSMGIQPEPMEDVEGEKGDRGSGLCPINALVLNGALCDGSSTLPANSDAGEGQLKEVMEEDCMEFDGRGDITSA